jgi:hypothetical protein
MSNSFEEADRTICNVLRKTVFGALPDGPVKVTGLKMAATRATEDVFAKRRTLFLTLEIDMNLNATDLEKAKAEVASLQAAIRAHRDQHGDDRCWQDDHTLYAVLPEGFTPPPTGLCNAIRFRRLNAVHVGQLRYIVRGCESSGNTNSISTFAVCVLNVSRALANCINGLCGPEVEANSSRQNEHFGVMLKSK